MPEPPSPDVAENAPVDRPQALTPDAIAAVLDDFRAWLAAEVTAAGGNHEVPAAAGPPLDLNTLLGQVIGLRQEVNLQTRATRAQQEQNADTLQTLGRALDTLRQASAAAPAGDEALRPLLKALTDLHDTLALSSREVQRMEETVLPILDQLSEPDAGGSPRRSLLARMLGLGTPDAVTEARQEQRRRAREAAGKARQLLASLVTGYRMSVQRVDRALRQQGLEPMAVVGQTFDPEHMEVVEAVADSGRPSGEVLEEVRRGYLYNGRVFRYAQVRVARG